LAEVFVLCPVFVFLGMFESPLAYIAGEKADMVI
jgi:hypothetical protein